MTLEDALTELQELRQDKALLHSLIEELRRDKRDLHAQVRELSRTIDRLTAQIQRLLDRLAQQEQAEAAAKAESAPTTEDLEETVPVPESPPAPESPPEPPPEPPPDPPRPPRRHAHGRKPPPAGLARDTRKYVPERCAHCESENLRVKESRATEQWDYVRGHLRVRRSEYTTCTCNDCGEKTTLPGPPAPFDRASCTAALLAWVVYAKYGIHLPLERTCEELNAQGGDFSTSTLSDWVGRAAALLEPFYREFKALLLEEPILHTDGTGLKVLEDPETGERGKHSGQVAFYGTRQIALYAYTPGKHGHHTRAFLKDSAGEPYAGTVVADAASVFDAMFSEGPMTEAGCNAHGRRKFGGAEEAEPVLGREGVRFLKGVYRLEAEAREKGLSGEALLAWRQSKMKPVMDDFRGWMAYHKPTLLPKNPVRKAIQYYENHWRALTRFLDDPQVPLDNNLAERLLRAVAVGRKNWLFAGNAEAAQRACVILSAVETCRLNGVDAYEWLTDVFDRVVPHPDNRGVTVWELLPWTWKKAREQAQAGPSG